MAEYIVREALIEKINREKWLLNSAFPKRKLCVSDVLDCIYTAPAADVVEVVRCKDCVYYIPNEKLADGYDNAIGADGLCDNTDLYTWEDDYCSDGRKG